MIVRDVTGRWWYTCEDVNCPSLEHPEDLHSHELVLAELSPEKRANLLSAAKAELARRGIMR